METFELDNDCHYYPFNANKIKGINTFKLRSKNHIFPPNTTEFAISGESNSFYDIRIPKIREIKKVSFYLENVYITDFQETGTEFFLFEERSSAIYFYIHPFMISKVKIEYSSMCSKELIAKYKTFDFNCPVYINWLHPFVSLIKDDDRTIAVFINGCVGKSDTNIDSMKCNFGPRLDVIHSILF